MARDREGEGAGNHDSVEMSDDAFEVSLNDGSAENSQSDLFYGIEDRPPWLASIILALQHSLTTFLKCVGFPILMAQTLCMSGDPELLTRLFATMFLVVGASSILQCSLGSRLPIFQAPSYLYVVPITAMLRASGRCPVPTAIVNSTEVDREAVREEAYARMQQVQGALLFASLVQAVIGFSGLIGILLRFIGPICIGVTVFSSGYGTIRFALDRFIQPFWYLSIPTVALVVLFATVLHKIALPLPGGGRVRVFAMFPLSLAAVIMWGVCAVLTYGGVWPDDSEVYGYDARVGIKGMHNVRESSWVALPYPGQWGLPTINSAGMLGILAAVLAGVMDSTTDYYACARITGAPPPPNHAVNRGLGMEAIGLFMGGLFGTCLGVTSNSATIALIKLSKVGSRMVVMECGAIVVLAAFFTKFSALMYGIPLPVFSAVVVPYGMVMVIGMASFHRVNMQNTRNVIVIGISIFAAIGIPIFVRDNRAAANTGKFCDRRHMVVTLLIDGVFVGAVLSALLDNVLPGSYQDRGMVWMDPVSAEGNETAEPATGMAVYDLPFGMDWIKKLEWMRRIPFSPTFPGTKEAYGRRKEYFVLNTLD